MVTSQAGELIIHSVRTRPRRVFNIESSARASNDTRVEQTGHWWSAVVVDNIHRRAHGRLVVLDVRSVASVHLIPISIEHTEVRFTRSPRCYSCSRPVVLAAST